ncbi:MAG: hypothetical protein AAF637_12865 [Pseudomonadota bacterium]
MTAEQRCEIAKAQANWKWHRCRSNASAKGLRQELPDDEVASLQARCDDRHDEAHDRADRRASRQDDGPCAGDSGAVRAAMLGNTAAVPGSGPTRNQFGVNIFGNSGNPGRQEFMIKTLYQHGVRNFRVNNIGGWPENAYDAINELALGDDTISVYVPSQYFGTGQAAWQKYDAGTTISNFENKWSNIKHWIIQLDACNPVEPTSRDACPASKNNPTEHPLGALTSQQLTDYIDLIAKNVPKFQTYMHDNPGYTVEFVIPCNDCDPTAPVPAPANLASVKLATVGKHEFNGISFSLARTEYPFWCPDSGCTKTVPPRFPAQDADDFDDFAKRQGFAGAYFAESGWPRKCTSSKPHQNTKPLKNGHIPQCDYLKSLLHSPPKDPRFVTYYFVMGGLDVGDTCGPESWGAFTYDPDPNNPTLACPF